MKKKIFSLLLILSMVLAAFPGQIISAEESGEILPQVLFKYTGDSSDSSSITSLAGTTSVEKEEDEHGNVLKLEEGGSFFINSGKSLTTGKVVISWDAKANASNETYARIYSVPSESMPGDTSKMFDTFIYMTDGSIRSFNELYGWQVSGVQATYDSNKWHHIDLWFDLDKRVVYYYLDGSLITTVDVTDKFDQFCGFSMAHVKKGIGADMRFDNIAIGYAPKNGYKTGFDFCKYIPPEVENPVCVEFEIDKIGHAFFDKNIPIKANLTNAHDKAKNLELNFKVYKESGILKYEQTDEYTIKPTENYVKDYNFTVDEYGYYNAYLEVRDKDSGEVFKTDTRFSCLHGPEDGVFNEMMGFNNHFQNGRGMNRYGDFLDMMADAGFKYTREGINWDWVEKPQGVYAMPENHGQWIPKVQANNQQTFALIGVRCWLYNNEVIAVSDSEVGHWADYVENLAMIVKPYGIKEFEVGNELNIPYNRGTFTAEQYVRLLKEAYPRIKKHIPDATVYAFCTANVDAIKFIRECLDLGAAEYFDGISIHPYNVLYRPEEGPYFQDVQDIKNLMKEYNIEDKSLVYSEYGWTCAEGYATEEEQARYSVRASALSADWTDLILWYVSIDKVDVASPSERYFGMVRGWKGQEVNFEPKPAFAAMSNYNAFVAEAEKVEDQKILDDGGYISKFKDKDGSDIFIIWKIRDGAELKLDIGAENAVVHDIFGNPTEIKAENGIVQLSVSEDPIYLTGNFTKCEEVKGAEVVSVVEDVVTATLNDSASINITGGRADYNVEVILPENMELVKNTGFVAGKAELLLKTGTNPEAAEKIKVIVKGKDGGVIYTKEIDVEYKTALSYDFSVKYYKSGRWQGVLKLTNNNRDSKVSGTFTATSPSTLVKYVGTKPVGEIDPGQTELFKFNIPASETEGNLTLSGSLDLSTGEKIEIEETTYFTSLMPIGKTPTIDGKIELGEYNTNAPVKIDKADMVQQIEDWAGVSDASATAYINYDKDYFYLAAVAEDNALGDNDEQKRIWANDSIQFAFANNNVSGSKITEIGIGLVNGEPQITRYSFLGTKENIMYLENEEKEGFNKDMELQITRDGTKTVYELKLPWEDVYATTDDFNRKHIYFSTILNDNDGKGRRGWLEFCPGIGGVKNAMLFSKVAVGK